MDFEYTITDVITVDREDFQRMKKFIANGATYEEAFDKVAASWDDVDYYNSCYIKDDVIKELKRRIEQSKESKTNSKKEES